MSHFLKKPICFEVFQADSIYDISLSFCLNINSDNIVFYDAPYKQVLTFKSPISINHSNCAV